MSLMNVHVNVAYDPSAGANFHYFWATLLPPAPGNPIPGLEMIATQMWTAGYFLGTNKFTDTVEHKNFPICQADHDIGILIPDITFPPVNLHYLLMWPFSSRKMAFSAASVKFNGQPVACSQAWPIPLPMMTCGNPFKLPTAFPIINWLNQLKVGMSLKDLLMGIAQIAVSIAISAIFNKLGKGKETGSVAKEIGKKEAAKKLAGKVFGYLGVTPASFAKRAVSAGAGFGFSALDGNPTFKLSVGGGPVPKLGFEAGGDAPKSKVLGVPGLGIGNTPTNDPLHIVTQPE